MVTRTARKHRSGRCRLATPAVDTLVPAETPMACADAASATPPGTAADPLHLRTLLSEGSTFEPQPPGQLGLPGSLSAAVGDYLRALPAESRDILEMLAVLNLRMPIAQLGHAAMVQSPSAAMSRRWPPAWWTGGPQNRAARWRSATCGSEMPFTSALLPQGAACCIPAPL